MFLFSSPQASVSTLRSLLLSLSPTDLAVELQALTIQGGALKEQECDISELKYSNFVAENSPEMFRIP